MTEGPHIDFLSADTFTEGHPHELYRWMRENAPVYWHPEPDGRPGFWAVMRYDDILFVNSHREMFSHKPASSLEFDGELASGVSMVNQDRPRHTDVRRTMMSDFLPRAIRGRKEQFDSVAEIILDEVVEKGECDFVEEVAGRMSSFITADLLEIPREDAVALYEHIEVSLSGTAQKSREEIVDARAALEDYGRGVLADRRANPGVDLCSRLANDVVGTDRLTDEDFLSNFSTLVIGAGDTTRHLISGGMLALFEHPDQRELLAREISGTVSKAVEEMLRWVTPVIYNRRTATADYELGGQEIRVGDKIALYYGSGNRDDSAFDEPYSFVAGRTPNMHLSFSGVGEHFCIGAHVARAEANAMFRQVLTRLPDIEQAGPVEYEASNNVSGPAHLPVKFTPTSRSR